MKYKKQFLLNKIAVSLLVRLWVEILQKPEREYVWERQPPCEAVSWNDRAKKPYTPESVSLLVRLWVEIFRSNSDGRRTQVSLLVRLWVEIYGWYPDPRTEKGQPPCEAVSWNEKQSRKKPERLRQPPCEAVSWNRNIIDYINTTVGQPPCEAVSWNMLKTWLLVLCLVSLLVRLWVEIPSNWNALYRSKSASLWGCELK